MYNLTARIYVLARGLFWTTSGRQSFGSARSRQIGIFGFSVKNIIKWQQFQPSTFSGESSQKFWTFELLLCLKVAATDRQTGVFENRHTNFNFWDRYQISTLLAHFFWLGSWTISRGDKCVLLKRYCIPRTYTTDGDKFFTNE